MYIKKYLKIAAELLHLTKPLDQLVYTFDFDVVVKEFNRQAGTAYTPREVWEYCVSARKRGLVGARFRSPRGNP